MSTQPVVDRDVQARDAWKELPIPGKPQPGFAIIVREDPQQFTKMLLPEHHKRQGRDIMAEARVLAVGDHYQNERGEWVEPDIMPGDRVLTQGKNGFATHKIHPTDEVVYEFLAWKGICGVLDEIPERKPPSLLELPGLVEDESGELRPVEAP